MAFNCKVDQSFSNVKYPAYQAGDSLTRNICPVYGKCPRSTQETLIQYIPYMPPVKYTLMQVSVKQNVVHLLAISLKTMSVSNASMSFSTAATMSVAATIATAPLSSGIVPSSIGTGAPSLSTALSQLVPADLQKVTEAIVRIIHQDTN